jgi:hypothetical protein
MKVTDELVSEIDPALSALDEIKSSGIVELKNMVKKARIDAIDTNH